MCFTPSCLNLRDINKLQNERLKKERQITQAKIMNEDKLKLNVDDIIKKVGLEEHFTYRDC